MVVTSLEAPTIRHTGVRAAWNITGLWGASLLNSREKLLAELFPDLNQEYDDCYLTSTDPQQAFQEQREDTDPDANIKIWQFDGFLLSTPAMEANQSNSRPLRYMAHAGRSAERVRAGCHRASFLRDPAHPGQGPLPPRQGPRTPQGAHEEIGDMNAEKVWLQQAVPTDAVAGPAFRLERLFGTQLEAMASVPQSPETLPQIQAERIRL
jgi:hypothetical protein